MLKPSSMPPVALVRNLIKFDPLTGRLSWKYREDPSIFESGNRRSTVNVMATWNARYAGSTAFNRSMPSGYLTGKLLGRSYLAHRIAWLIHYGEEPEFIDHINGRKGDNRIANLRSVSCQENAKNRPIPKSNNSGCIGVHWVERRKSWRAVVNLGGKIVFQKEFKSLSDAVSARLAAEQEQMFHANHGRPIA